jgi:putative heme transporter
MVRGVPIERIRTALFVAIGVALGAAVWFQRTTLGDAVAELRSMSAVTVVVLVALGVGERILRADTLRRLLGQVSFGRALTIHDVGTAVTKGVPLGGPIATGLRWAIARDADISTTRFASALVGHGVAATFAAWLLPLAVLAVEVTQRSPTATDMLMLAICAVVLAGSVAFWAVLLRSERVSDRIAATLTRVTSWIRRRRPSLRPPDLAAGLLEVRSSLRLVARRPGGLLLRTTVAQASGAVMLYVALRGLGVGDELGALEFARVFFVVTLLSSFVPVPGGVGVVEVGLTGGLVAAGVAAPSALAAVVVYRLLTYVVPIALGAVLYVAWRAGVRRRRPTSSASPAAVAVLS